MQHPDDVSKLAAALDGLPVLGTRPGSPAAAAGIRYGDILLAVNGQPTPDWGAYMAARELDPRGMIVELFRDGERQVHDLRFDRSEPADPLAVLMDVIDARVLGDDPMRPRAADPEPS